MGIIVCSNWRSVTADEIRVWADTSGVRPACATCGRYVDAGGTIDHFHPYMTDYARCADCVRKEMEKFR